MFNLLNSQLSPCILFTLQFLRSLFWFWLWFDLTFLFFRSYILLALIISPEFHLSSCTLVVALFSCEPYCLEYWLIDIYTRKIFRIFIRKVPASFSRLLQVISHRCLWWCPASFVDKFSKSEPYRLSAKWQDAWSGGESQFFIVSINLEYFQYLIWLFNVRNPIWPLTEASEKTMALVGLSPKPNQKEVCGPQQPIKAL